MIREHLRIASGATVAMALSCLITTAAWGQDTTTDENRDLFANFLHNAVLGKFDRADAYAQKLIDNGPDPLDVMGYADEHRNALKTLILLVNNEVVSDSAKTILDLIREGERQQRQDPARIKLNIDKLGGDPLTEFNAINRLKESGEYAVPWLVQTLLDSTKKDLHNRVIRMLPKMGKDAVTPLSTALATSDPETQMFMIEALGKIGYPQAAPFLLAIAATPDANPQLGMAVEEALIDMAYSGPRDPAAAFLALLRQYYVNHGSVRPDSRLATANVWYWKDERLERVEVPVEIYDEIMTMRSCERALSLDAGSAEAIAIWLAANIRREADLGMQVESDEANELAAMDPTKPEDFPRSAYFARAAGPRYCHRVLDLALQYREPAVALGAIAALRSVAGASSLVGAEDFKQPLAAALTFPDMVVRIKAALALAGAMPNRPFSSAHRVVPSLAEGLAQRGGDNLLVIDPDPRNLNRVMGALRGAGSNAIGETTFYSALERSRIDMPGVSGILLASDVFSPQLAAAIATLRDDNIFRMTPVVILMRDGQTPEIKALLDADEGLAAVTADADAEALSSTWKELSEKVGQTRLHSESSLELALACARALRDLGIARSEVLDFRAAEGALVAASASSEESLQSEVVQVLAMLPSSAAQQAIARIALADDPSSGLRITAFAALADSAKVNANLLTEAQVDRLLSIAMDEPDLTLRTAASRALGALNLPSNKAGAIIEKYERG